MHQPGSACVHRHAPGRARVSCRRLLRPCRERGPGRVAASCRAPPRIQPRPSAQRPPCCVRVPAARPAHAAAACAGRPRLRPSACTPLPPVRPSALPAPAARPTTCRERPAPPARAYCAQCAVSWPCSVLYRNTAPALGLLLSHDTL